MDIERHVSNPRYGYKPVPHRSPCQGMPPQEVCNGGRKLVIQGNKCLSQMIFDQPLVPELRKDLHIPIYLRTKGGCSNKTSAASATDA